MSTNNQILEKIDTYEVEFGFKDRVFCSKEDSAKYEKMLKNNESLPVGIFFEEAPTRVVSFFTIKDNNISDDVKEKLLMYQNAFNIRAIKKCISFITGLIVAGLIIGVLAALSVFAK